MENQYLHLHVEGHPKGYYTETRAWGIVEQVTQGRVKFLAGPFTKADCEELRADAKARGARPLPIFEE